ncbi:MAG: electron transport complex subunit E [Candidatus Ratteibacteria bacterium]|nr:electron transport complex subunit E [Candidatus Ratteibacteria bacterium]
MKEKVFTRGFIRENPVLILMIGLCPIMACSTSLRDALGMGLATIFVLFCSNFSIALIRRIIPPQIRIPVFIVIISTFVTITDYTMHAYLPALYKSLGVFVPLIVVNCIILGRAEAFASKNSLIKAIFDGLGMGIGFLAAIGAIGLIREALGTGAITNPTALFFIPPFKIVLAGEGFSPAVMMILPPGAFLTIGFLIAGLRRLKGKTVV